MFFYILFYLLNLVVFIYSCSFVWNFLRTIKIRGDILYPNKEKVASINGRHIITSKSFIYKIGIISYFVALLFSLFFLIQPVLKIVIHFDSLEILLSWIFIYNGVMGTRAFEIKENGILYHDFFYDWSKVNSFKLTVITRTHKHFGLGEPGKDYFELEIELQRKLKILPSMVSYLVEAKDSEFLDKILTEKMHKDKLQA